MRQRIHLILLFVALLTTSKSAADGVDKLNCPVVRIEAERLPDMNVPRSGHSAILVNGEVTVLGGHTSGFVLTPTAEYLKDGEWHQLQTVYNHDGGISIVMKSGKVLLAGGFKDNLGIGQSYEVELYDPVTHQFNGFGCLDKKRVSGAAVELDSGRVMIAGNWYANDAIEMFDGKATFSHVKSVAQSRSLPHVFRTSNDNALIVAGYDFHGNPIDTIVIDRLYGEPFRNELFDNWKPLQYDLVQHSDDSFIGDEAKGLFRYLMPVENKDGQLAIIDVRDTVFTPLPTSTPVPMKSQWGTIKYITPVFADRHHQRGYVVGFDATSRLYVLCIDYSKTPAPLTLYHTDPLPEAGMLSWIWWLLAVALFVTIAITYILRRRRPQPQLEPEEQSEAATKGIATPHSQRENEQLMQRICNLMDGQQLYLQQGLKVSDIASALDTNIRYISDCIRAERGCSLTQFVNEYRLEHAKRLLLDHPEMKISSVAIESGFTNDKAMTRYFKEHTGMTPTEWKTTPENDNNKPIK